MVNILINSAIIFIIVLLDCSVVSDSLRPPWTDCPWDSPGKSPGVGCRFLLQGIVPTQGLNLGLPHCRQILDHLSHQGSPIIIINIYNIIYYIIIHLLLFIIKYLYLSQSLLSVCPCLCLSHTHSSVSVTRICRWRFQKGMYQAQVFGPTGIPSEHLKVTEGGRRQEERLPLCLLTGCPLLSQILSCPVWQLPTHLMCGQFLGIAGGQGFHGPEVPRDMGAAMGVATPLLRARRLLDIFFFFQFF